MKLNQLLGTEFPFIQGGMANIATAEFAAAVSNAGALGLIGAGGMSPEVFQDSIRRCRTLTEKPFGVNIMLMHPQVEQLAAIADRLLTELEERAARQGYTLRHTAAAARILAGDKTPPYGARELRRTVSRAVEQALADRIAAGTAHPGIVYTADAAPDGSIVLVENDLAACV